tara:strand:- start:1021 stop:1212 length:192 start_codon:yes stop_codon:yes gene_type:complete
VLEKVLYAETDINRYKIGQTIPKTYPGGLRFDFISPRYHGSLPVLEEDNPPKIKAIKVNKNTE